MRPGAEARLAVLLGAAAIAGASGCGHMQYDRLVVELDEATQSAVLDAVAKPLELRPAELLRQVRPSYIGIRWKL